MRPVESLSGGESQKVVIARALAQEPEVLLLDEPTSSLDLRNQMEVMALVKAAVKERNLAAVISMHDLNLAFRHLEQVLLLKDGAVHAIATPDDIQPETIREVYGVEVVLSRVLGHPIVIPTQTV
jgi:iron complex transport system ATP-binding protein